jgi:predicted ATP-dependent endonuclease of OLD family
LVGPNNVGKSTVIEALRTVIAPPQFMDRRERHVDQAVRISMVDTTPRTKSITNPGLGAVISSEGQAFPTESHFRYVPSRRPWAARAGPQPFGPVDYWRIRTAQGRDQDGQLIGRLSSFGSEEYSDGQIYLEYTTLNGSQHHADLFGDGIASLFRIALALYDPDIEVCVAIDEPELSLHPQAQKRLANFISCKASHRQIILCTHSPYFVNWNDLIAGSVVYRFRQTRNGIVPAKLSQTTMEGLKRLFADWEKPQLLDPVAREVFFADEVVFFEGQEDIGLVRRFAAEEQITPIQTFGYGVGGAGNIKYFPQLANDLGIPACAVFDGSSKPEWEDTRKRFPDVKLELLPTDDIRDKPAREGRKAREGMFNENGTIKRQHRQYMIDLITEIRTYLDDKAAP